MTQFIPGEGHYRDCTFVRETLRFEQRGRVVLGTNFRAEGCTLHLGPKVELLATDAEFTDCRFVSKSQKRSSMQSAHISKSKFEGTFRGWKFGGRGRMPVVYCDFRGALVHDCEFYDCNIGEQTFDTWPTVVFVRPHEHAEAIRKLKWPRSAEAQIWMQTLLMYPCEAFVVNADLAAKDMASSTDELKHILGALKGAVLM